MKVGILTFHMAHNCGAMLQAYALSQQVIKLVPHAVCEIIDYRFPPIYKKYENMLQADCVPPRRLKYDEYMKSILPLSKRLDSPAEAYGYDLYIIGGDQVWNPDLTYGYCGDYFGDSFPEKKLCISYAASTGNPPSAPKAFAGMLRHFQMLAVRESWLVEILRPWCHCPVQSCLDPVLLLNREVWETHRIPISIQHYTLIFSFQIMTEEYSTITQEAQKVGSAVVELITHERSAPSAVSFVEDYGPREFLSYIRNADLVYTDSYHCVLFSLIFQRPFSVLKHGKSIDARLSDLFKRLNIYPDEYGVYDSNQLNEKQLEKERSTSISFLCAALEKALGDCIEKTTV